MSSLSPVSTLRRLAMVLLLTLTFSAGSFMRAQPAWARYILDYGDSISVTVVNAPQYSFAGSLRPDGVITLPVLGDMEVRGLSTEQIRDRIRDQVGKIVRDPLVTVVVTNYKPRAVTVVGEVTRPGSVDIPRADWTVIDALASAGGLTDHAIPREVVVLRGNGAATRRIPVDVEAMLRTGDLAENVKLEPGDRVQVPRSPWPTWSEIFQGIRDVTVIISAFVLIGTVLNRTGASGN